MNCVLKDKVGFVLEETGLGREGASAGETVRAQNCEIKRPAQEPET